MTRKFLVVALILCAAPAYAFRERKVSTTSYPNCFKMVDSSDHVTAKTSLTITCTRSKNGGSYASCSGAVTEVANGVYCIAGHATDRDTVGVLAFHVTGTAADPNDFETEVTTYDPFLYPDTGATLAAVTTATTCTTATNLTNAPSNGDFTSTMKTSLNNSTPASVTGAVGSVTGNVGGNVTGSVGSVASGGITATSIAADAIGASELAADAVTEIQSGLATAAALSTLSTTVPTAAENAAATWAFLTVSATTSGSMGAFTLSKLGLLTSGTRITIADPVQETTVSIVPGTAYTGVRQPKLTWPIAASERDLTSATPRLVITDGDTALLAITGAVTSAGTESQAVEFSVTAAQSTLLTSIGATAYTYQINATWAADSTALPVRLFDGSVDTRPSYQ